MELLLGLNHLNLFKIVYLISTFLEVDKDIVRKILSFFLFWNSHNESC